MTIEDPLDDLERHAIKFPGPTLPMSGLRTALAAVEDELVHARDQATIRLHARHKGDPERHPDDREVDLYELQVTLEQILPRVFRGGFVLTLWSVFEVVSKRMAEYVGARNGDVIAPSQWKQKPRETFLDVLDRVYSRKLGIQVFPDPNERLQLDQLRELRNALIHHNGSVKGLPEAMRSGGIEGYAAIGLDHYTDLHEEFVIPNADFIRRNFALVDKYLKFLDERAYGTAHPTAAKAKGSE
jgi:hypothetical protein